MSTIMHDIIVSVTAGVVSTAILGTIFAAMRHTISQVHHEVVPNSGSSLRDAVDRIELVVKETNATVGAHAVSLATMKTQLEAHLKQSDEDHTDLRSHLAGGEK